MLKIICIIETTPKDMLCFDTTYLTFDELKARVDLNVHHEIVVEDLDEEVMYGVKLSQMMVEQAIFNTIDTWLELLAHLTIPMMELFAINPIIPTHIYSKLNGKTVIKPSPINTSTNVGPKIISCTHDLGITMDYGTRANPSLRNKPALRHMLTDIIFKHDDVNDPVVDFENCIPVISGKVHFPVPFANELYAVNGSKVIASQTEGSIANLLIDFAPLGGMDLIRFKDCTKRDIDAGVAFDLPEGKTLDGKTYLVVIAGRFFFDYECQRLTSKTIAFNPHEFNLNNIQLSNKTLLRGFIQGTETTKLLNGVDYIDSLQDDGNYESFIVLINNPRISWSMMKPTFDIPSPNNDDTGRMFKFPPKAGGLLIRRMTREITDYFRQFDTDATIVMTSRALDLNRITVENPEANMKNIGYKRTKGNLLREHSINQEDDGYVLIDVITNEDPDS